MSREEAAAVAETATKTSEASEFEAGHAALDDAGVVRRGASGVLSLAHRVEILATERDEAVEELFVERCRICGCTQYDCSGCIDRTGEPCGWAEPGLCTACVGTVQLRLEEAERKVRFLEALVVAPPPEEVDAEAIRLEERQACFEIADRQAQARPMSTMAWAIRSAILARGGVSAGEAGPGPYRGEG